jgi:hypothetical protein
MPVHHTRRHGTEREEKKRKETQSVMSAQGNTKLALNQLSYETSSRTVNRLDWSLYDLETPSESSICIALISINRSRGSTQSRFQLEDVLVPT